MHGCRRRSGGAPRFDVDDFYLNRTARACGHARRRLPVAEAAVAHVALAHDSAFGVVLRDAVRAIPRAVLTADARVSAVEYDAGRRVFLICVDGTALQTCRLETVMAADRHVRPLRVR